MPKYMGFETLFSGLKRWKPATPSPPHEELQSLRTASPKTSYSLTLASANIFLRMRREGRVLNFTVNKISI